VPPPETLHEHLKALLCDVGSILGYHPEKELREGLHRYDVVWRNFPGAPLPSRVFEVQDRGSLEGALVKLQHAKDIWRSLLFLVVTGEGDRKKVDQYVRPWLVGTFHQLSGALVVLSPDQLEDLYESLNRHRDLLRKLLAE
jgi:hypothetical protein